jgi:hypothetical protein
MRKKMPTITERAAALVRLMQDEPDGKKRQRLHALSLVASGQARHRHSVAAWFAAYTAGGLEQALQYHVPTPTRSRRITETALTALKAPWQTPAGFPSSGALRPGLAEPHPVHVSSSSIYALVRGELRATPKRPRPSHAKKVRRP